MTPPRFRPESRPAIGSGSQRAVTLRPPREQILAAIEQTHADLVLLGTHGKTGVAHLLLGSVAEHVIRLAPVPIIVVP